MTEPIRAHLDHLQDRVEDAIAEVKPKLRGWLHAGTAPLALAAGITLIALSPTPLTRIGSTVFALTALLVFTVSAVYHRGSWSPGVLSLLKRFDHANIYLLIAGTLTPFALLLLDGTDRLWMLGISWTGALAGVAMQLWWTNHPRWISAPIYIALGWAPIFFFGGFVDGSRSYGALGVAILTLVVVGGALYTIGAVAYGTKRPNPWPRWFGFHEVFHSFTVFAFAAHYTGISMATYALR